MPVLSSLPDPLAKKEEPVPKPPVLKDMEEKEWKEERHFIMKIALFCAVCVAIMWYVTHIVKTLPH